MRVSKLLIGAATALCLAASAAAADPIRIGISIPSATHGWTGGLNFQVARTVEAMKKAFPDTEFYVAAAGNVSKQVNDVEDLVATHHINALVILPFESEPLTGPVKEVRRQGVFVTVVDRGLSEPGIENLYVGGNNPQYGVVAAEYFKSKFPQGGNIVVMRGIPTTIDNIRIDAFKTALEGSKIKILDMQFANWNPDKGFQVMQDYLQRFPDIDGVWAGDDDAATGALEAIRQSGRDKKIALLGGSGMNRMVKDVMDGGSPVDADIFYPPTIIIPAIELTTMKFATQAPIQGRYVLDSPLITRENAKDYYFPASPY
jgi:ribose transport system substrate-binding protein